MFVFLFLLDQLSQLWFAQVLPLDSFLVPQILTPIQLYGLLLHLLTVLLNALVRSLFAFYHSIAGLFLGCGQLAAHVLVPLLQTFFFLDHCHLVLDVPNIPLISIFTRFIHLTNFVFRNMQAVLNHFLLSFHYVCPVLYIDNGISILVPCIKRPAKSGRWKIMH